MGVGKKLRKLVNQNKYLLVFWKEFFFWDSPYIVECEEKSGKAGTIFILFLIDFSKFKDNF